MSDTTGPRDDGSARAAEQARHSVEQAEAGEVAGARTIERLHERRPEDVEAVEQEAADGPAGRGLSR